MTRSQLAVLLTAFVMCSPSMAYEKAKKKAAKAKTEVGASCKAPAVGTCAACSITCRPGEQPYAPAARLQATCVTCNLPANVLNRFRAAFIQ